MRCRIGDLAILVRSNGPTLGRIGRVLRPGSAPSFWWIEFPRECQWIDINGRPKTATSGDCPDEWLRPLRPGEGADQTLTWAGKPQETPTEIIRRETERVS